MNVGDVVTTSYGTGPYRIVRIYRHPDGDVSLVLHRTSEDGGEFYLNSYRLVDGTWRSRSGQGNDTLTIAPPPIGGQPGLFGAAS